MNTTTLNVQMLALFPTKSRHLQLPCVVLMPTQLGNSFLLLNKRKPATGHRLYFELHLLCYQVLQTVHTHITAQAPTTIVYKIRNERVRPHHMAITALLSFHKSKHLSKMAS